VTVEYPEGRLATYRIVGEDEIEPEQNTISWRSPMARGLMGKTPGDEVEILRPTGSVVVVVKSVVYI
jgi:transcription elongation GreA/GreB family factor